MNINFKSKYYIIKNKDEMILKQSQSGGIFRALADEMLIQEGSVYGCVLTDELNIEHIRATDINEVKKMSGSKYVQSDLKDTFKEVKKDLENRKKVLFVGTPCQINGLKKYIDAVNVEKDNLICVDIICHGVPSPGVWKEYLKYIKHKNGKIENFNFRNKKYGWNSSVTTFECNGKEKINNVYNTLFFMHYIVRPSCFECKYKNIDRVGDITIGDAWGINEKNKFYDKKGTSLVMINSLKGNEFLESIKNKLFIEEVKIEEYMQPAIFENYRIPNNREKFWYEYKTKKFDFIAKKYGGENIFKFIKRKIKKILKIMKRVFVR